MQVRAPTDKSAVKALKEDPTSHFPKGDNIKEVHEMNEMSPAAQESLKNAPEFSLKPPQDSEDLPTYGPIQYPDKSTYTG